MPELRTWGQSPIHAIAWRNRHADLVGQLRGHQWVDDRVDRAGEAPRIGDGVRFGRR